MMKFLQNFDKILTKFWWNFDNFLMKFSATTAAEAEMDQIPETEESQPKVPARWGEIW